MGSVGDQGDGSRLEGWAVARWLAEWGCLVSSLPSSLSSSAAFAFRILLPPALPAMSCSL